jgi:hypothetical protein
VPESHAERLGRLDRDVGQRCQHHVGAGRAQVHVVAVRDANGHEPGGGGGQDARRRVLERHGILGRHAQGAARLEVDIRQRLGPPEVHARCHDSEHAEPGSGQRAANVRGPRVGRDRERHAPVEPQDELRYARA